MDAYNFYKDIFLQNLDNCRESQDSTWVVALIKKKCSGV